MHEIQPGHVVASKPSRKASIIVWDASPVSLLTLAGVLDHQGYSCVCARTADSVIQTLSMGRQDLIVADVGDDAAAAIETLQTLRKIASYEELPAILIAGNQWAGLEKKTELMSQATRCLFRPIDPLIDRGGRSNPVDAQSGRGPPTPWIKTEPARMGFAVTHRRSAPSSIAVSRHVLTANRFVSYPSSFPVPPKSDGQPTSNERKILHVPTIRFRRGVDGDANFCVCR